MRSRLHIGVVAAGALGLVAATLLLSSWWLLLVVVGCWAAMGYALFQLARAARGQDTRWRDVMPCYLSVQDRGLKILEVNSLLRRDLGDDAVGRSCFEVYKQASKPCAGCPVLKTLEDGKDHSSEEIIRLRDGSQANVVVTSTPLRDARGNISAVIEMSTNITELSSLRGELDRTRQRYQRLFDIVPCYISIQDCDYRVVESNALFKQDFGESVGEACYRVYKGRDSICPGCPVQKTFADGLVHSSEENVVTRDGRQAAMIVYSMPIVDAQGQITQVMEVSTNITQVKELQRQLALVGLAVTGMAHRIKNVMMGLEGGIFVVNSGFEMDEHDTVTEGWEMVQRNAAKISQIARDLLFCSKERAPRLEAGVSPAAIAHEVYELYRARAEHEGIALELDVTDEDVSGTYDGEAVHSLLNNLVANAIDACRFDPAVQDKQPRIDLRLQRSGERGVRIEVQDNGMGIAHADSEKVFEGFFSTKGTEGTGLGLFVVQKVVREHGGDVRFASKEGQGTTFTVELPSAA